MLPRDWLYIIPLNNKEHILYAPLHKKAVRLTMQAVKEITTILNNTFLPSDDHSEVWSFLNNQGLLELPTSRQKHQRSNKIFLSITNQCNLRCIYCYANTGLDKQSMSFSQAKKAVDYQLQQIIASKERFIAITFHGGGEALIELSLLKKIVSYVNELAIEYNLIPVLGCVTNASLITKEVAKWLSINFSHLTVSLDGTKSIQDIQRPYKNGSGSFAKAMQGIENLLHENVNFDIRSTVTNFSIRDIGNFVYFIKENIFSSMGNVDFEPVSLVGRAKESGGIETNVDLFFENYILARQIGEQIGINVSCSLDTFGTTRDIYCGATTAALQCYTPDGNISACTRVIKNSDDGATLFHYGELNDAGVIINNNQKSIIESFGINLDKKCYSCFARWNCFGGCPLSRYNNDKGFDQMCLITKKLLLNDLKIVLNKG